VNFISAWISADIPNTSLTHTAGTMKPLVLSSQKRERIKTREMKERNLRYRIWLHVL